MAWYEKIVVPLVFLMVVDSSITTNKGEAESFESIAAELKQLNQRVNDLELKDKMQTKIIARFEYDLESSRKLNSDLRRQQSKHRELIRGLENSVAELRGQMEVLSDNGKEPKRNLLKPPTDTLNADHRGMVESAIDPKSDTKKHGHNIRTGNPILHELPINRGRHLAEGSQQVAFSATIKPHDYGPLGKDQIVLFDNVLTNIGNGYHAHSGIFTAPVGGVYVVSVTIAGLSPSDVFHYLQVMVNGGHRCSIWAKGGDQSSQLLVLNIGAMDEVYVSNYHASDIILGDTYSSFSGFLLYSSDGSNVMIGK